MGIEGSCSHKAQAPLNKWSSVGRSMPIEKSEYDPAWRLSFLSNWSELHMDQEVIAENAEKSSHLDYFSKSPNSIKM